MKVSDGAVRAAYEIAKRVDDESMRRSEAVHTLHTIHSLTESTARDLIDIYRHMKKGENFTRKLNEFGTAYYLEMIFHDFGSHDLRTAINAVQKHLNYYKKVSKGQTQPGKRKIVQRYQRLLAISDEKVSGGENRNEMQDVDDEMIAFEGAERRYFMIHRQRERRLREEKIKQAMKATDGQLRCQVPNCGFDFFEVYGDAGRGYAHVHHLSPLSQGRIVSTNEVD